MSEEKMKTIQVLEGKLDLGKTCHTCIYRPDNRCDQLREYMYGLLIRKDSASNIPVILEDLLWHLNKKHIRITVEVKETP